MAVNIVESVSPVNLDFRSKNRTLRAKRTLGANPRREGGINTKLELFDYGGWMFGQDKTTILNMIPLKIYGHCDEIKITAYRG